MPNEVLAPGAAWVLDRQSVLKHGYWKNDTPKTSKTVATPLLFGWATCPRTIQAAMRIVVYFQVVDIVIAGISGSIFERKSTEGGTSRCKGRLTPKAHEA